MARFILGGIVMVLFGAFSSLTFMRLWENGFEVRAAMIGVASIVLIWHLACEIAHDSCSKDTDD